MCFLRIMCKNGPGSELCRNCLILFCAFWASPIYFCKDRDTLKQGHPNNNTLKGHLNKDKDKDTFKQEHLNSKFLELKQRSPNTHEKGRVSWFVRCRDMRCSDLGGSNPNNHRRGRCSDYPLTFLTPYLSLTTHPPLHPHPHPHPHPHTYSCYPHCCRQDQV